MAPQKNGPQILFFPPLLFFGTLILAAALEFLWPLGFLPAPFGIRVLLSGVALMGVAVALAVSGMRRFKAAATNVNPYEPTLVLVTGGPYRFTRNPMYLGMVLFQPGAGLAFSFEWSFILAPLLLVALHFGVVLREEAYLSAKFGGPYHEFLAHTRRWF